MNQAWIKTSKRDIKKYIKQHNVILDPSAAFTDHKYFNYTYFEFFIIISQLQ